jgi:hypothetical protein
VTAGDRRYAYVVGAGHSGSTLVSFLLNTHPSVLSIGEMHAPSFVWRDTGFKMCSCGSPIKGCPFFRAMAGRFEAEGASFDPEGWDLQVRPYGNALLDRLAAGSLRHTALESVRDALAWNLPGPGGRLRALAEANRRFVRHALELTGTDVFVDANKEPIRISFLRRAMDLPVRFVHLVRDPRAYANSRIRDRRIPAARAARDWWRTHSNAERLLATVPARDRYLLRYEDLCRDPGRVLGEVGEFLGVGPIAVPDDLGAAEHHIMGNKMRLSRDRTTRIRLDDSWKRALADGQVADVVRIAGPLARALGFEL